MNLKMSQMESLNLCDLPNEQRQAIEADKAALLWLYQMRQGLITRVQIQQKLQGLKPELRELTRAALNKHR